MKKRSHARKAKRANRRKEKALAEKRRVNNMHWHIKHIIAWVDRNNALHFHTPLEILQYGRY